MKKILGVDPGKLTGIAVVDYKGNLYEYMNATADEMKKLLANEDFTSDIDHIVMEHFILYGRKAKAQTGSKMPSSKVIGMVELWASMNKIPIKLQMANILPIAMKQGGIKPKGSHKKNHWIDAYNHVYYWLVHERGLAIKNVGK